MIEVGDIVRAVHEDATHLYYGRLFIVLETGDKGSLIWDCCPSGNVKIIADNEYLRIVAKHQNVQLPYLLEDY